MNWPLGHCIKFLFLTKQSPFWNWNVTAINNYDFNEKRTSVLFVSVSFIILMLISLAWLLFYYVQRFRYIHAKDRLERRLCGQAKRALAIIPIITLTKDEDDEDSDTCPGKFKKSHPWAENQSFLYCSVHRRVQSWRNSEDFALQSPLPQGLHWPMVIGQTYLSHVQDGYSQILWTHWRLWNDELWGEGRVSAQLDLVLFSFVITFSFWSSSWSTWETSSANPQNCHFLTYIHNLIHICCSTTKRN